MKMITYPDTIKFIKGYFGLVNKNKNDVSTIIDRYSCWSILLINGVKIDAKIIHKGGGKFKIVEDKYKAKYVNEIVDASDVICCKVESKDVEYNMKYKSAYFSGQKMYLKLHN